MKIFLCCMILGGSLFSSNFVNAQSEFDPSNKPTFTALNNQEDTLVSKTSVVRDQSVPKIIEERTVSARSFILPATLIGAGVISFATQDYVKSNDFAKGMMWKSGDENRYTFADNISMFAPAIGYYGLQLAGIKGEHNAGEATLLYAMSSAISNGIVFSTKHLTHVQRPNESDYLSFPSGHTAQAFVSAEFLRQEYKDISPWYGAAGYAFAIGTGMLRMYHNKHWFTDVVTGAGVGILSTRFSYWLYPKIKQSLFPKSDNSTIVAPLVNISNGTYGLSLVHSF